MTKPHELVEAEMVYGLCQTYHCLPSALRAESADILRMHAILSAGGYFEQAPDSPGPGSTPDPFAGIPMVAL